jgi:7-keto-8-aminopelargonate synthetase-like enzyme
VIVTDSVFSMDGDVAPLAELVELAHRYDVRVVVDEAHALGTTGPGGRGAVAQAGLEGEVDVVVGTLGKALGSYGAYVCCDAAMARYLTNTARSLIFSTALPPPAVAGALAALELLTEQPGRVDKLQAAGAHLREQLIRAGVPAPVSQTQIIPLVVGDAGLAMELCERVLTRGVFAQAIRPPTVAPGSSRLRLAVMASHTPSELARAAEAIALSARELHVEFREPAAIPVPAPVAEAWLPVSYALPRVRHDPPPQARHDPPPQARHDPASPSPRLFDVEADVEADVAPHAA